MINRSRKDSLRVNSETQNGTKTSEGDRETESEI